MNNTTMVEEDSHSPHSDVHAYTPILWAFSSVFIGMLIKDFGPSSRIKLFRLIPYTGLIFLFWTVVELFNNRVVKLKYLGDSIDMWCKIDPHLLLYVFLPALLFGDAKAVDTHLLGRKLKEITVLATFGVVIGSVLIAAYAQYLLPYNWTFEFAMVFGSILSATDPVAVVSLLNDLGAPPALTLTISGESMFNDGTAIVLFNLFLSLYSKNESIPGGNTNFAYTNIWDIVGYGTSACVGGAIVGLVGGILIILMLLTFESKLHEENSLLQLTMTISMSYLVFFVAEGIWGFSGVIATVTAGIFFSEYSRGLIVSKEVLNAGWEMLEFMGNTLIFSLAGLIVGKVSSDADMLKYVGRWEVLHIFISWTMSFFTRMIMLFLTYPLQLWIRRNDKNKKGVWVDLKDMSIQGWGGLRGAVGLALAVAVRNQNVGTDEEKNGTLLLIHVVGVASLTLLINATTASLLLSYLGMTKVSNSHQVAVNRIRELSREEIQKFAHKLIKIQNEGFDEFKVTMSELKKNCHVLRPLLPQPHEVHSPSSENEKSEITVKNRFGAKKLTKRLLMQEESERGYQYDASEDTATQFRELFLKLVRSEYNNMMDHSGIVLPPERHESSRLLLNSTLEALDDLSGLHDWDILQKHIEPKRRTLLFLNFVDWVLRTSNSLHKRRFLCKRRNDIYASIQAFIIAHEAAQEHLVDIFHHDEAVLRVVEESKATVRSAMKAKKNMDERIKQVVAVNHLTARVLILERRKIVHLVENGVLTEKDEEELLKGNEEDFEKMKKLSTKHRESFAQGSPSLADMRSKTIVYPEPINAGISRRFNRTPSLSFDPAERIDELEGGKIGEEEKDGSHWGNDAEDDEEEAQDDVVREISVGGSLSAGAVEEGENEEKKTAMLTRENRARTGSFREVDKKNLNAGHMPAFHRGGTAPALITFTDHGQDLEREAVIRVRSKR